jgi:hypothetical protein
MPLEKIRKKLKLPWSHGKPFRWKKGKPKKKKIKLAGGKFRKEKMEFIENYTIHTKIRRKKNQEPRQLFCWKNKNKKESEVTMN